MSLPNKTNTFNNPTSGRNHPTSTVQTSNPEQHHMGIITQQPNAIETIRFEPPRPKPDTLGSWIHQGPDQKWNDAWFALSHGDRLKYMFEANPHMTGRVANLTLDTENLRVLVPNQLPAHWIEPKTTEQEAPGGLQENREPEPSEQPKCQIQPHHIILNRYQIQSPQKYNIDIDIDIDIGIEPSSKSSTTPPGINIKFDISIKFKDINSSSETANISDITDKPYESDGKEEDSHSTSPSQTLEPKPDQGVMSDITASNSNDNHITTTT